MENKINKENRTLETKNGDVFHHGEEVLWLINNELIKSVVSIVDGRLFLCQNIHRGSSISEKDKFGMEYSYSKDKSNVHRTLFKNTGRLNIEKNDYKIRIIIKSNDVKYIDFYKKDYPDCCGSTIIHDFTYNIPDGFKLTEEEIKFFKGVVHFTTNVNCITLEKWDKLNNVLEQVGFKQVDRFKNSNTNNICLLYSINT